MLTSRDFEVIDFVKKFKVATTQNVADVFFPSLSACQKRMKIIADEKKLIRARDSINNSFIYYHKQPKQLKHSLLVTRFYAELVKRCEVKKFIVEPDFDYLRPDAVFMYSHKGRNTVGVLEVEISNKGFDWVKYERFIRTEDYKKYMTVAPMLYIISDKMLSRDDLHYKIIKTDFSNFYID